VDDDVDQMARVLPLNLPDLARRDAPHTDLSRADHPRVAQNTRDDPAGHIDSASVAY
jgi:hypothetical protein